jgi:hypothetical protein
MWDLLPSFRAPATVALAIAIVAKHKLAPAPPECWIVAVALVRSATSPLSKQSPASGCRADGQDARGLADALLLDA